MGTCQTKEAACGAITQSKPTNEPNGVNQRSSGHLKETTNSSNKVNDISKEIQFNTPKTSENSDQQSVSSNNGNEEKSTGNSGAAATTDSELNRETGCGSATTTSTRGLDGSKRDSRGSLHDRFHSRSGRMDKLSSAVDLEGVIEAQKDVGALTSKLVHIEVPLGKPIEEVYDGVHDGSLLGSGISGLVRLCTHKKTGVKYAVKCLDLGLIKTEEGLQQLREEIFIMCQLDHPNIVRLEEVYESHSEIYLVQELCLGGELFDRLDEQPDYHYTEQQCAMLVKQMLSSVRYIHSKGIVHRDLKLENFLFSSTDPGSELKMIDFGFSKHFEFGQTHNDAVGTPYTVAPEVIRGQYDERCDVWAIGVITYLLLSGDPPFGGCGGPEPLMAVRDNILRGEFEFEPEEIWANVSEQAKEFIRSLLVTDPKKRPTARGAQHSRWLKEWAVKETKSQNNVLNPNVVKALVTFKEYGDMRKLLCEVLSFTLLPDQIKDLRSEFEKLDKDGSGEISLYALKKVLMENAGAGSLGALTEGEVEDIFNAMRVRKNETTIQWHEFIAAGLSQCEVDDRNLRLAFDRLDSDHKGYITYDNIVDLMGRDGTSSEESMRRMYFDGVKDCQCKNAQITYEDFLLLMKGQKREPSHPVSITSSARPSIKLEAVPEIRATDDSTDEDEIDSAVYDKSPNPTDFQNVKEESKTILPGEGVLYSPPSSPNPRLNYIRSQSVDLTIDEDKINDSPLTQANCTLPVSSRLCVALPEHVNDDNKLAEIINDETKTPLQVNRNLYRAHRQMRLAVLEASKRFEDEQARRVLQEQQKKISMERVGAGLVMKHGQTRKLSTEEVRKILEDRQKEQQVLLEKANKQSGRGRRRRKKTVSDMSAMLVSSAETTAPNPLLVSSVEAIAAPNPPRLINGTTFPKVNPCSCPSSPAIQETPFQKISLGGLPFLPSIDLEEPVPVKIEIMSSTAP